jgi:hypothetical protein
MDTRSELSRTELYSALGYTTKLRCVFWRKTRGLPPGTLPYATLEHVSLHYRTEHCDALLEKGQQRVGRGWVLCPAHDRTSGTGQDCTLRH